MNKSKLSEHVFKKGKFITPWNNALGNLTKNQSWNLNRLPEYLWLGLILDKYDRKVGLEKVYLIIKKLQDINSDINAPAFSHILKFSEDDQLKLFSYISQIAGKDSLSPLTLIYAYSDFKQFSRTFVNTNTTPDIRIAKINSVMEKAYDHQSEFATDIRFIVLFFSMMSGNFGMPNEQIDLLLEYPRLDHANEKMRLIRPTIRSAELMVLNFETPDQEYLSFFWERISTMSDCELFTINWPENSENSDAYIELLYEIFQYFTNAFKSTNPLDKKSIVLLGIATYSYKRLCEVHEFKLYNSISARSTVRNIIENYIMMKYLLKNEDTQENIWSKYQMYGIALYKVVVARFRDTEINDENSHVDYKYLELLVNEYMDEEFLDMDTSYFDKQNIRLKAQAVDEKDLFGLYYDYDSSFEHGMWGAIRESSLLKCNCSAHQYHCVPDFERNVKLKSVWPDCIKNMNKIITIINDIYPLPSILIDEVKKYE